MSTYLDSLKEYVGFTDRDTHLLQALLGLAVPYFEGFSEHFYERITAHPEAHQVLQGPEQVERLKRTLVDWMHSGLAGPHDELFYQRRSRIGRVHVQIGLPQQFMFTAMNVMRLDFHHMIADVLGHDSRIERETHDSLDKLFDLELAIMLRTYQDDSEDRMRRSERLATIGHIAASIGHDLRNPLSVIQSSMYILARRLSGDEQAGRHIQRILAQVELCNGIISNLLQLARNRPPRREPIDFHSLIDKSLSALTIPQGIRVQRVIEDELSLQADAGLLSQALINLIDNALEAYGSDPGTICIEVHHDATDGHVVIEVADEGPGFSQEAIAQVFEPLVTTRETGTGLGLALVKGITERHGGTVEAFNRPKGGAVVRLRLPSSVTE